MLRTARKEPTMMGISMSSYARVAALGFALVVAGAAAADDCERCGAQHRARFQVESTREVSNDWVVATLGITSEDVNPAVLADRINKEMAWALEQARAESRVKAKTGGYSTYPISDEGRIRRWQANQQLVLEGGDTAAMTALVGKLQARLQLQAFQFSVSEEKRRKVQEELVTEALAAFRTRAQLVAKGLDASGYSLDDVSVETGSPVYPMHRMEMATMAADSKFSPAPPAVEGGSSRVSVTVSGAIVLD
jgi:predicted secreted protein